VNVHVADCRISADANRVAGERVDIDRARVGQVGIDVGQVDVANCGDSADAVASPNAPANKYPVLLALAFPLAE
jgi:hypothetical protein